jgi:hypothetical protein
MGSVHLISMKITGGDWKPGASSFGFTDIFRRFKNDLKTVGLFAEGEIGSPLSPILGAHESP